MMVFKKRNTYKRSKRICNFAALQLRPKIRSICKEKVGLVLQKMAKKVKLLSQINHYYGRAIYAKHQFQKAVKNKKEALRVYSGSEWDDAVYFLILLGRSDPKLTELQDIQLKAKKVDRMDIERYMDAVYMAKSVEAMELNLSSKVKDNKYHSLNLTHIKRRV
jgi:hypothetical protein